MKSRKIPRLRENTRRVIHDSVEQHSFQAALDCHYSLHLPAATGSHTALVVALHGFGQSPREILPLMAHMVGRQHAIAALEAPYAFYKSTRDTDIGHSWITRKHAASDIRLHHDMVLRVLNEVGERCGIPAARRILAGFSQPVGINYRFAATYPDAVRGVIGICGGIPSDWETAAYRPVQAALLHIAREQDEFYKPELTASYAGRLRLRASDVEFHLLPGGHTMPSKAGPLVEKWLNRIL